MTEDSNRVLKSSAFLKIQGEYKVHPWSSLSRGPLSQQENPLAAVDSENPESSSEEPEDIRWQQVEVKFTI